MTDGIGVFLRILGSDYDDRSKKPNKYRWIQYGMVFAELRKVFLAVDNFYYLTEAKREADIKTS